MAALLWLIFLVIVCLNIYHMWHTGQISSVAPQNRRQRLRLLWVAVGAVNFVVFVAHVVSDGTCAFPTGGRLVAGQYLVLSHGKDIPFTPNSYWFSYIHGIFFVILHLVCIIACWRLLRNGDSGVTSAT